MSHEAAAYERHKAQMREWYHRNREYQRRYRKHRRRQCDCGQPATVNKGGFMVCAKCDALEQVRELHEARRAMVGQREIGLSEYAAHLLNIPGVVHNGRVQPAEST